MLNLKFDTRKSIRERLANANELLNCVGSLQFAWLFLTMPFLNLTLDDEDQVIAHFPDRCSIRLTEHGHREFDGPLRPDYLRGFMSLLVEYVCKGMIIPSCLFGPYPFLNDRANRNMEKRGLKQARATAKKLGMTD